VFGLAVDGKRESLRFGSVAKAQELEMALIVQGHTVAIFEYSAAEVDAMTREAASDQFMSLGVQYYIAARSAVWARLLPVCGNLYHHSVEMFLKSGLARKYTLLNLRKKFGHKLPVLWNEFKKEFPAPSLSQFDTVIADVEEFEDVRYPDNVLKHGAQMVIDLRGDFAPPPSPPVPSPQKEPLYKFYFDDVDRLIGEIFIVSSRNPLFYTSGLKPEVKELLARGNPVAAQLLPPSS
jgi:hypothetical protein